MIRKQNNQLDATVLKNSIFGMSLESVKKNYDNYYEQTKVIKQNPPLNKKITDYIKKEEIDKALSEVIAILLNRIKANTVVNIESLGTIKEDEETKVKLKVSVFKKDGFFFKKTEYTIKENPSTISLGNYLKKALLEGIKRKVIDNEDLIISIDDGVGTGIKGNLSIFYVKDLFINTKVYSIGEDINAEVIDAIINIAVEIGREGREGKHVGTGFVIGNAEELSKFTKQMILNPFSGYPDRIVKITDPEIKETIKNFAQLDGVFIINKDGKVISAGTYLSVNTDIPEAKRLKGFGTRHRCVAAITKQVNSIGIVVSESGGKVRVFKKGKILMTLL